ncbi:MAG: hypothetical protein B7X02_00840 [Rhodospirillales bacterium 12-54-5]|nr:MAG: hypothetical protein B7X02_00840 [Rhodospirillales bacterium 12-54-5]
MSIEGIEVVLVGISPSELLKLLGIGSSEPTEEAQRLANDVSTIMQEAGLAGHGSFYVGVYRRGVDLKGVFALPGDEKPTALPAEVVTQITVLADALLADDGDQGSDFCFLLALDEWLIAHIELHSHPAEQDDDTIGEVAGSA